MCALKKKQTTGRDNTVTMAEDSFIGQPEAAMANAESSKPHSPLGLCMQERPRHNSFHIYFPNDYFFPKNGLLI